MKRFALSLLLAFAAVAGAQDTFSTKTYRDPHALGLKRTEKSRAFVKAQPKFELQRSVTPVPGKYDLTPRVSPPENQGNCGSCWAFGITKALRSAEMLAGKDPGTLAFNYLVNNCGSVHEYGCGGGDFDAGQNFLSGKGPWLESQDHYTESDGGRCLGLPPAATALTYKTVGPGNRPPTFEELATVLSQDHELVVDVAVCGAWGSYSGGIFNRNECGPGSINHIINMNGYNCETSVDAAGNCVFVNGKPKNGDGYLIAMNNWGTGWGEQGYMRTRWGVDAIADTAMYFEVKQDPKPAPTCSVEVSPASVVYGSSVALTVTSTDAVSAVVNGQSVATPKGSVQETAAPGGALPQTMPVSAKVTGADGQTATCSGSYVVTAVPGPTPVDGGVPLWAFILGGLVILGTVIIVVVTRK